MAITKAGRGLQTPVRTVGTIKDCSLTISIESCSPRLTVVDVGLIGQKGNYSQACKVRTLQ